jgi:hypothetical protein
MQQIIDRFSERFKNRVKIIYVSIDNTEEEYLSNIQNRQYWLSMEFNDGSSATNDRFDLSISPPVEPYLLATEPDLEADVTNSYCRPFSRVYLTEKFQVYGVPQLVVYNIEQQKILTKYARISQMKGENGEAMMKCWEDGKSSDFGFIGQVLLFRHHFKAVGTDEFIISQIWFTHCVGLWPRVL